VLTDAAFAPSRCAERMRGAVVAARAFGRVAASLRRAGRETAARAYGAMIAATAIANNLPVYTRNPSDLAGIEDLQVQPVPVPPPG
jgi:tRNA(fMet)-specific endonuclease VapC